MVEVPNNFVQVTSGAVSALIDRKGERPIEPANNCINDFLKFIFKLLNCLISLIFLIYEFKILYWSCVSNLPFYLTHKQSSLLIALESIDKFFDSL